MTSTKFCQIALSGLVALVLLPSMAGAVSLTGVPHIIDGDTIRIGKVKIRLHGIDAPEAKQECKNQYGTLYKCGEASTEALRQRIGSKQINCNGNKYDRYMRLIGVCFLNNINLNAEMVRMGWAVAYRRYSKDYVGAENEAEKFKQGIWAGEFEMPWDWRHGKKRRGL